MDFACGSGSLLLNVRKRMNRAGGTIGKIFGQEKDITTYNLARMNMLLHGAKDTEFEIFHGDTLLNEWAKLRGIPENTWAASAGPGWCSGRGIVFALLQGFDAAPKVVDLWFPIVYCCLYGFKHPVKAILLQSQAALDLAEPLRHFGHLPGHGLGQFADFLTGKVEAGGHKLEI